MMLARTTMSAAKFARLRKRLGLNNSELAAALGISRSTAQRCEHGHQTIPQPVAKLLRMYARYGLKQ